MQSLNIRCYEASNPYGHDPQMSLRFEQLIFTCFAGIGFRTLASDQVPTKIQQAFIKHIAHRHWDAYNPPDLEYRAAYLYQVAPGQTLFGWVYNDGCDDLGRSHIPYFLCYYLAQPLDVTHLHKILACLQLGPVAWIDRHHSLTRLQPVQIPDSWLYSPVRSGVPIPASVNRQAQLQLTQGNGLDLLMIHSGEEGWRPSTKLTAEIPLPLFKVNQGSKPPLVPVKHHPVTGAIALGVGAGLLSVSALAVAFFSSSQQPIKQSPEGLRPSPSLAVQNPTWERALQIDPAATVWSVAASPGLLTTANSDHSVKVWHLKTGRLLRTLSGHQDTVWSVAASPTAELVASGSSDQTVKVWSLNSGGLLYSFQHMAPVWAVAVSPDGTILASSSGDQILLWSLQTGERLQTLAGHQDTVRAIAISADGQTLVSGSSDHTVKVWNLKTGHLMRSLTGHRDRVLAVAISPDGQTLVSGSVDQTLQVWDLDRGQLRYSLPGNQDWVNTVAISPDGTMLASGIGKTIRLWTLETGQPLQTLAPNAGDITSLAFGEKGQTLIGGSREAIIIWYQSQFL